MHVAARALLFHASTRALSWSWIYEHLKTTGKKWHFLVSKTWSVSLIHSEAQLTCLLECIDLNLEGISMVDVLFHPQIPCPPDDTSDSAQADGPPMCIILPCQA